MQKWFIWRVTQRLAGDPDYWKLKYHPRPLIRAPLTRGWDGTKVGFSRRASVSTLLTRPVPVEFAVDLPHHGLNVHGSFKEFGDAFCGNLWFAQDIVVIDP